MKTVCRMCNKPLKPEKSVFDGALVCKKCHEQEGKRSAQQDVVSPGIRSRPPKYMLHPSEYKKFGY